MGVVVGSVFFQFGNDASKTIFNYGYLFITLIIFMFTPLMPVLLKCELNLKTFYFRDCDVKPNPIRVISVPTEVQLLKREYFNRWYGLNAYFCALTISQIPMQVKKTKKKSAVTSSG